MLPRHSQAIQCRKASRLAPGLHIELRSDASNEFRRLALRSKHAGQKKQIARLHCFRIHAEGFRRCWKRDAKFAQPLLGAGRPRAFAGYHLPACAPPSTCKISPVVKVASIKNKTASTTSLTSPIAGKRRESPQASWRPKR